MITAAQAEAVAHRRLETPVAPHTHYHAAILAPGYAASMANIAVACDPSHGVFGSSFDLVDNWYKNFNAVLRDGLRADPTCVSIGAFAYGEAGPADNRLIGFVVINLVGQSYKVLDCVAASYPRWPVTNFLLSIWTKHHAGRLELTVLNRAVEEYGKHGFDVAGPGQFEGSTRLVYTRA